MNKTTLMLIAALTLGGAATANAATPAPAPAAKVQTAKKAPVRHHVAAPKKTAKHS